MNKLFNIIVAIIFFILGLFFMHQCGESIAKEKKCIKYSIVTHDSTVVFIDTIKFIPKKPIVTNKGNYKFDSTLYKDCASLNIDTIDISDTLIKGFVKTKIRNNQLDSLKLSYITLFPKYIKRDSIIYKSTTEYNTMYQSYEQNVFYIGGSLGTNDIGVSANIKNKKDFIYGYKFGITYNGLKTHSVQFNIPVFKSKNKNKNK